MKLIVGLGNPGTKYQRTRHNAGFLAVETLAKTHQSSFRRHIQTASQIAKLGEIVLAKPQTFMNNSGRAVSRLVRHFGVDTNDVLVIYDDVDLPLGQVRFRATGSSGGHHGMQSIIDALQTQTIARIRIGVSKDANQDTSDYVLAPMAPTELTALTQAAQSAGEMAWSRGAD